jgi:hypothetical protein
MKKGDLIYLLIRMDYMRAAALQRDCGGRGEEASTGIVWSLVVVGFVDRWPPSA